MSLNSPTKSPDPVAIIAAGSAFLLFAGQFVISKHGVSHGLTPYDITFIRFSVAGLIAMPFILVWGLSNLGGLGWRRGIILTTVSGLPYFIFMISGLSYAPASHAVVLNPGMTMIGSLLIAALWLGRSPSRIQLLAGMIGLLGLAAIGWTNFYGPSDQTWLGDILFLATGLAWAVYMGLLVRWQVEPLKAALGVAFLSVPYIPYYLLTTGTDVIISSNFSREVLIQAIYQGVIHSIIAMALFAFAVGRLGASRVALMTPIVPASGVFMAMVFLGEQPDALQWLGAGLVCLSLFLTASHRTE